MQHSLMLESSAKQSFHPVFVAQCQTPPSKQAKSVTLLPASSSNCQSISTWVFGLTKTEPEQSKSCRWGPRQWHRYWNARQASCYSWRGMGRYVARHELDFPFRCQPPLSEDVCRLWSSKALVLPRLFCHVAGRIIESWGPFGWLAHSARPSCRGWSQRLLVSGDSLTLHSALLPC